MSLISVGIVSTQVVTALKVMAFMAIIGIAGLLGAPFIGYRLVDSISAPSGFKPSVQENVIGFMKEFLCGIEALRNPSRAGTFTLFTCRNWMMDGIGTVILAYSLRQNITLRQFVLLLAGPGLSGANPSTPGYVGVYQIAAVIILQSLGIHQHKCTDTNHLLQVMGMLVYVT